MHPSKITRTENGAKVMMDVTEYLFVHSQRLPEKEMLRPINTHKYSSKTRDDVGEKSKKKETENHRSDECDNDADPRAERKLYQRALGLFNKLVVNGKTVTCTCENFRRFGKCEDSELIAFVALGEKGFPTQKDVIDFNACKDGYSEISLRITNKLLDLVDAGTVCIPAPPQDPAVALQDPGRS